MADPLAELREQLDESEQERLVEHLEGIAQGNPRASRRDLLQAGGALGAGALLGGSGAYAATQAASADPSTSDSDGNVGTPNDRVDVFGDGVDTLLVTTGDLDINGEVIVEVEKTSDQSYSAANGDVIVAWDNEVTDITGSFDLTNDSFSPPETGTYDIDLQITSISFSDQDDIRIQFWNTTDNIVVMENRQGASGTNNEARQISAEKQLNSSKTYKARFRNVSGDDVILGTGRETYMTISRSEEN